MVYRNLNLKQNALAGISAGAGIVGANVVAGFVAPRIPVNRTVMNVVIKFLTGVALAGFAGSARLGTGTSQAARYASIGALGSAFSDLILSAVPPGLKPGYYGYMGGQFAPPVRQYRPAAHINPARPGMVSLGPSVGPSITSGPRAMPNTRPQLVNVSRP